MNNNTWWYTAETIILTAPLTHDLDFDMSLTQGPAFELSGTVMVWNHHSDKQNPKWSCIICASCIRIHSCKGTRMIAYC